MCSTRSFGRHWHDSFGFGLLDQGGQVSASGRGQVQALAGQIITTNPGEVHDGMPLGQQARRWRMVYVAPQVLADTVGQSEVELTRPVLDDPLLRQVFGALFRHWIPSTSEKESGIHEELLTRAIGLLAQRHGRSPPTDARLTSLYQVRECLLDQLDSPPTLNALAELAGLSRYQLVRQFSQVHGLPPFAWLQQHRLRHAQALIAQGAALSDAALNSGFSDQSHLTRAFARYLGFTPGSWQRAQRLGVQ
nr:AraC family transcriptional regulator [uncultured Rhodoferax sp.]